MGAALTDAEVGLGTSALSDADVGLSPSSAALSDAEVGLTAPSGKRAQPGSASYIAQGVPAAFESLFRMGMGMVGQTAGALVGGVEAIPELVQGEGQAAADIVRGRMQAGGTPAVPGGLVRRWAEAHGAAGVAPDVDLRRVRLRGRTAQRRQRQRRGEQHGGDHGAPQGARPGRRGG